MALKLITGKTETENVTADIEAGIQSGIFGTGNYWLNNGTSLSFTVPDNNTVGINTCMICAKGYVLYNDALTTLAFENGTQGYSRTDSIFARIMTDSTTSYQTADFIVVKGENGGTAPTMTDTALIKYVKIADVGFSGLTLVGTTSRLTQVNSLSSLLANISTINSNISSIITTASSNYTTLNSKIDTNVTQLNATITAKDTAQTEKVASVQSTLNAKINDNKTASDSADRLMDIRVSQLESDLTDMNWTALDSSTGGFVLESNVSRGGGGAPAQFRFKNGVLYIKGQIMCTNKVAGTPMKLFTIPSKYRGGIAGSVLSIFASYGNSVSRVALNPVTGEVSLDWCRALANGTEVTGIIQWIALDITLPV